MPYLEAIFGSATRPTLTSPKRAYRGLDDVASSSHSMLPLKMIAVEMIPASIAFKPSALMAVCLVRKVPLK